MRKLLIAGVLLLSCGCGSSGYGGKYTLYRSRMMSPPGIVGEKDINMSLREPGDPDEDQCLCYSYLTWQP